MILSPLSTTSFVSVSGIGDSIIRNNYTSASYGGNIGTQRTFTGFGAWLPLACALTNGLCYTDIYALEGYSGQRSDQVYGSLLTATATEVWDTAGTIPIGNAARLPKIIVEMTGTNDITQGYSLGHVIASRRALWSYIQQLGARPIAMSLLPRQDQFTLMVPAWNAAIKAAAEDCGVEFVDGYSVCDESQGSYWDTDFTYHNGANDPLGLHPSFRGSLAIAQELATVLTRIIGSAPRIPRIYPGSPTAYSQAYRSGQGAEYFNNFGIDGSIPSTSTFISRYDPQGDSSMSMASPSIDKSGGGTLLLRKPSATTSAYADWMTSATATVAGGQKYLAFADVVMSGYDGFSSMNFLITDTSFQSIAQFGVSSNEFTKTLTTPVLRLVLPYTVPSAVTAVRPLFAINRSSGGIAGGADTIKVANVGQIRVG